MKALRIALAAVAIIFSSSAQADLAGTLLSQVGASRPAGCPKRLWCACGLSRYLKQHGLKPLPSFRAIDARCYGIRAKGLVRNNILVFPHHVGVATGKMCSAGRVQMVSANHSNRVGVGCYKINRIVAVRKAVR